MSKDNSVKPLNTEEETYEGGNSVKMDVDDHPQPESGLLNSSDSTGIRITKRNLNSENIEAQKKQKGRYVLWLTFIALSEILGTAMLVFLGCLSTVPALTTSPFSHFQSAITCGVAIYISVVCFSHISGSHINPIVTIAALIFKLVSLPVGVVYITGQFIGAIIGYGGIMMLVPRDSLYRPESNKNETHGLCTTVPNLNVSVWQALLGEYIASAILIYICCVVWDKKNISTISSAPAKLGIGVFVLVTVLGPISGCSMNPARSFAPALFTGIWKDHWVYWLGPVSAAVFTPYFYKFVFEKFQEPDQASGT